MCSSDLQRGDMSADRVIGQAECLREASNRLPGATEQAQQPRLGLTGECVEPVRHASE